MYNHNHNRYDVASNPTYDADRRGSPGHTDTRTRSPDDYASLNNPHGEYYAGHRYQSHYAQVPPRSEHDSDMYGYALQQQTYSDSFKRPYQHERVSQTDDGYHRELYNPNATRSVDNSFRAHNAIPHKGTTNEPYHSSGYYSENDDGDAASDGVGLDGEEYGFDDGDSSGDNGSGDEAEDTVNISDETFLRSIGVDVPESVVETNVPDPTPTRTVRDKRFAVQPMPGTLSNSDSDQDTPITAQVDRSTESGIATPAASQVQQPRATPLTSEQSETSAPSQLHATSTSQTPQLLQQTPTAPSVSGTILTPPAAVSQDLPTLPVSSTQQTPAIPTYRTEQPNYDTWLRKTLREGVERRKALIGKKPGFLVTFNKDKTGVWFDETNEVLSADSTTLPLSKIKWAGKKSFSQLSIKTFVLILKGNDYATVARDAPPLWLTCPLTSDRLSRAEQAAVNNQKEMQAAREGLSTMKQPDDVARFFFMINDANHVNEFIQIEDGETRSDFENRTIGVNSAIMKLITRNFATPNYCVNHATALIDEFDENGKNLSVDEHGKRKKVSDARKPIYPSKPNWTCDVSVLDPRCHFQANAIKMLKKLTQLNPRNMSLVNAIKAKFGDQWEPELRAKLWEFWKKTKADYARAVANKDTSGNNQPNFACFTPSIYPLIMHAYMKDNNNEDLFAVFTRETVPGGFSSMHDSDDEDNERMPTTAKVSAERITAAKRDGMLIDTLADIGRQFKRAKNDNRDVSAILRDLRETRNELKNLEDEDEFMKSNLTTGLSVLQAEYRRVVEENAAKEKELQPSE